VPVGARRVLGVDVGEVRTGLAVSDPGRVIATPVGSVPGGGDLAGRVLAAARERGCDTVVVGLPKAMNGRDTASTTRARAVAAALGSSGLQVHLWDERLSSVEAERMLLSAGRRREQRRRERDPVAAVIVLQGWLDAQRSGRAGE
jgi:putative holliday junction resolvase